jgi:DNA modification methylase
MREIDKFVNKIFNEDAYEFIKKLPDKSIDLIIIDPPYLLDIESGGGIFHKTKVKKQLVNDNLHNGFDFKIFDDIIRISKKLNLYVFCSQYQIPDLLNYFVKERKYYFTIFTWHKLDPIPTFKNKFLPDTEYIFYFREKGVRLYNNYESSFTFYISYRLQIEKLKYKHPTIKPEKLIAKFIKNSSKENDIILDLFCGSGTTCAVAKKLNRRYIGVEINKEYYEISKSRIEDISNTLFEV